jgi:hypothetical protein
MQTSQERDSSLPTSLRLFLRLLVASQEIRSPARYERRQSEVCRLEVL